MVTAIRISRRSLVATTLGLAAIHGVSSVPQPVRAAAQGDAARCLAIEQAAVLSMGLDADPLANISNTRAITAVIVNGELLNREVLDDRLAALDAVYAPYRP